MQGSLGPYVEDALNRNPHTPSLSPGDSILLYPQGIPQYKPPYKYLGLMAVYGVAKCILFMQCHFDHKHVLLPFIGF